MTRLRYIGPIDVLSIPALGLTVARGAEVEVDGAAAELLLEQTDFEPVDPSHTAVTDDSSAAGEPDASPAPRRRSTRS